MLCSRILRYVTELIRETCGNDMRTDCRGSMILVVISVLLATAQVANSQVSPTPDSVGVSRDRSASLVCGNAHLDAEAKAALQFVCSKGPFAEPGPVKAQTIVIGFVGGFADPKDQKHPEVLFAAYLREHYSSEMNAEVFSNHDEQAALEYVLQLLDTDRDGILSDEEKQNARIIIYGHSWGASETAAFARTLRKLSVPVLLTVQLDIVPKFRQKPFQIPPNVQEAVNFYQSEGFLQGRPEIVASDPTRTEIIGNFRMTYARNHVNCRNYSWFARTFNKPHHEIENDPHIWARIDSLVNEQLSTRVHCAGSASRP